MVEETPSQPQPQSQTEEGLRLQAVPSTKLSCFARAQALLYDLLDKKGVRVCDVLPLHNMHTDKQVQMPTSQVIPPTPKGPGGMLEIAVFSTVMPENHTDPCLINVPGPFLPTQVIFQPDLNPDNPVYIVFVLLVIPFTCTPHLSRDITVNEITFLAEKIAEVLESSTDTLKTPKTDIVIPTPAQSAAVQRNSSIITP